MNESTGLITLLTIQIVYTGLRESDVYYFKASCLSLYCETMTFTMWENELLENTNTSKGKQEIASGGKFLKMFPKRFHT